MGLGSCRTYIARLRKTILWLEFPGIFVSYGRIASQNPEKFPLKSRFPRLHALSATGSYGVVLAMVLSGKEIRKKKVNSGASCPQIVVRVGDFSHTKRPETVVLSVSGHYSQNFGLRFRKGFDNVPNDLVKSLYFETGSTDQCSVDVRL